MHFVLSYSIVLMLISSVLLIILGAKGFKKLKAFRINKDIKSFRRFMSVKIALEVLIIALTTLIGIKF